MVTQDVMTKLNYKAYFTNAISYDNYKAAFQAEMEENSSAYAQYLPQNWSRQSRLDRKFKLNDELLNAVKKLTKRKNWLLITEHWCGDASQINPIINRIAEKSEGKINLRITYRDANEELIDAHLTDGRSRSIPILIELDDSFEVVKTYGPRPAEAQKLVQSLLAEGDPYTIPLHTWYAKDKQTSLQDDFVQFLSE